MTNTKDNPKLPTPHGWAARSPDRLTVKQAAVLSFLAWRTTQRALRPEVEADALARQVKARYRLAMTAREGWGVLVRLASIGSVEKITPERYGYKPTYKITDDGLDSLRGWKIYAAAMIQDVPEPKTEDAATEPAAKETRKKATKKAGKKTAKKGAARGKSNTRRTAKKEPASPRRSSGAKSKVGAKRPRRPRA